MAGPSLAIETVSDALPADLVELGEMARAEGFGMVARLAAEWASGVARFAGPCEALVLARCDGRLAGVAGITADPHLAGALRMRRVYVGPGFRRMGIGRQLALALIEPPGVASRLLTVNAGTPSAPAFWGALGFEPVSGMRHTHERQPDRRSAVETNIS